MKSRKKGIAMISAVCVALVLITAATLSGTLAKFISTVGGGSGEVPAAKFLFNSQYNEQTGLFDTIEWNLDDLGASADPNYSSKTLYPGAYGRIAMNVSFVSDVSAQAYADCTLTYTGAFADDVLIGSDILRDTISLEFLISDTNYDDFSTVPFASSETIGLSGLADGIEAALIGAVGTNGFYEAGSPEIDKTVYVYWQWPYNTGVDADNAADTAFGNYVASDMAENPGGQGSNVSLSVEMSMIQTGEGGTATGGTESGGESQLPASFSITRSSLNSLTAEKIDGAEYSADNGQTWQDSNVIEDLTSNQQYTILARIKGTSQTISASASTTSAVPQDAGGAYLLASRGDLDWLSQYVSEGNTSANAKLDADIYYNDISNFNGRTNNAEGLNSFAVMSTGEDGYVGTFDGQGHTIYGLYSEYNIDMEAGKICAGGLMEILGVNGSICNLNLRNSYLVSTGMGYYTGGIVGMIMGGNVYNCSIDGTVKGQTVYIGGITSACGQEGNIYNCSVNGSLIGNLTAEQVEMWEGAAPYIGGIVGAYMSSSIENCYNGASITGAYFAGGIVGSMSMQDRDDINGYIKNCLNAGSISGTNIGGICGGSAAYPDSSVNILNCYSLGSLTATNYAGIYLGEIADAGRLNGNGVTTIADCYYIAGVASDACGYIEEKVTNSVISAGTQLSSANEAVSTLNSWVSDNSGEKQYKSWVAGTGYPVFEQQNI